jgi:succinyl-diaminopimelate desuccinylase
LTVDDARRQVKACIGDAIETETLLALDAVASDPNHPWIKSVAREAALICGNDGLTSSVSYFTDASVLSPVLGFPPLVIVGPGDPALAHQVNESCSVPAIWSASQLYEKLVRNWAKI